MTLHLTALVPQRGILADPWLVDNSTNNEQAGGGFPRESTQSRMTSTEPSDRVEFFPSNKSTSGFFLDDSLIRPPRFARDTADSLQQEQYPLGCDRPRPANDNGAPTRCPLCKNQNICHGLPPMGTVNFSRRVATCHRQVTDNETANPCLKTKPPSRRTNSQSGQKSSTRLTTAQIRSSAPTDKDCGISACL